MKRVFLALPVLFIFSFPVISHATSGACSYHGGVDCAAGPQDDGNVICNDGWTGSSVSYDSMVECESYSDFDQDTDTSANSPDNSSACIAPDPNQYTYTSSDQCTVLQNTEATLRVDCAAYNSDCSQLTQYEQEITTCNQQVGAYNAEVQAYNSCEQEEQQDQTEASICPSGETWIGGTDGACSTVCPQGYSGSNGVCQISESQCQVQMGINSHVSGTNTCACNQGYQYAANANNVSFCQLIPQGTTTDHIFAATSSAVVAPTPSAPDNVSGITPPSETGHTPQQTQSGTQPVPTVSTSSQSAVSSFSTSTSPSSSGIAPLATSRPESQSLFSILGSMLSKLNPFTWF